MTAISNIDRIMLILRQRLDAKTRPTGATGTSSRHAPAAGGRQTIAALAAIEGIDERHLRRTFIQALLTEQLGDALVNDAKFQQIVTQVSEALEQDDQGRALLDRLMADLRAG